MEKHILVVLPHPDDEAFGISGSLASYIKQGTPITYVCLTLGEMGRNLGNPPFANRETLPIIRKAELEESCRSIGIQDLRMMGLRDKTVEFEDREMLIARIREVIDEVNPSLVITFYPGYSVHPDHDACGAAVVEAIRRIDPTARPTVHCIAFSKGCEEIIGAPDVWRDVRDFLPQKIGAIKAHRSQFQYFQQRLSNDQSIDDPELAERLGKERFWTYRFD